MFRPVKLLSEVMALAYLVNANTEYCTFIHYAGHVNKIQIQVCPNKNDYKTVLYESEFYCHSECRTDTKKELLKLKSVLESYLFPNTDELEELSCTN